MRWRYQEKKPKAEISADRLHALERQKFKKRGDLVAYAARHPGALTGYFLSACYSKLSKGMPTKRGDLTNTSLAAWASTHTGLTEMRDLREVQTLAMAMDYIKSSEVERAMDVLSQRVMAIQAAKKKGGNWERAEALELLPGTGSGLVPGAMLSLGV